MTNSQHDDDSHHKGLGFDLRILMSRRNALVGLGVLGAGGYFARRGSGGEANATGIAGDGTVCVADPAETAGPFPADGTNSKDGALVNAF